MHNDFWGHLWGDLPMIFTRDFITRENHWQIASLVTQKSLFTVTHALLFISFPNFNGCTVEVCEWVSNFIPNFTMDIITYPWGKRGPIKGQAYLTRPSVKPRQCNAHPNTAQQTVMECSDSYAEPHRNPLYTCIKLCLSISRKTTKTKNRHQPSVQHNTRIMLAITLPMSP